MNFEWGFLMEMSWDIMGGYLRYLTNNWMIGNFRWRTDASQWGCLWRHTKIQHLPQAKTKKSNEARATLW